MTISGKNSIYAICIIKLKANPNDMWDPMCPGPINALMTLFVNTVGHKGKIFYSVLSITCLSSKAISDTLLQKLFHGGSSVTEYEPF